MGGGGTMGNGTVDDRSTGIWVLCFLLPDGWVLLTLRGPLTRPRVGMVAEARLLLPGIVDNQAGVGA